MHLETEAGRGEVGVVIGAVGALWGVFGVLYAEDMGYTCLRHSVVRYMNQLDCLSLGMNLKD